MHELHSIPRRKVFDYDSLAGKALDNWAKLPIERDREVQH